MSKCGKCSILPQVGTFTLVRIIITRIVCLSFVALALWSFPEAQKLLRKDYLHVGNTIYIPLQICQPSQIDVDGSSVIIDTDDVGKCRSFKFLVTACNCSLLLSAAATLIFLVIDALSRYGKGAFNRSSVAGMGFFLIFILIQTSVSLWALVSEVMYWTQYFQEFYDRLGGGINIRSYGNTIILLIAGSLSLSTSLVVFVEAVVNIRNSRNKVPKHSTKGKSASPDRSVKTSLEDGTSPTEDEDESEEAHDHVRAWTSY